MTARQAPLINDGNGGRSADARARVEALSIATEAAARARAAVGRARTTTERLPNRLRAERAVTDNRSVGRTCCVNPGRSQLTSVPRSSIDG